MRKRYMSQEADEAFQSGIVSADQCLLCVPQRDHQRHGIDGRGPESAALVESSRIFRIGCTRTALIPAMSAACLCKYCGRCLTSRCRRNGLRSKRRFTPAVELL